MIESCTLIKSSKSFLFSRDDKEVVRYSCSQPPDLIPRQLDVELEEVPVICIHPYIHDPKGRSPPQKTGFFGNFSQVADPPSPPFGNPCFQKKKCGLFCPLGHLEHFWSSLKCSLFGNYSDIYFWE